MTNDSIPRNAVSDYVGTRQQNFGPVRVLNPDAEALAAGKQQQIHRALSDILDSVEPHVQQQPSVAYEIHLVDDVDVADTQAVSDGGQLLLIDRHYIAFLRNMVESLCNGIEIGDAGSALVSLRVTDDESKRFGNTIGDYLEVGVPLTSPQRESGDFGPAVLIAALEFVITHEIVHRIEAHSNDPDHGLTGFQDFCRLRGREYFCDQKAVSLVLKRRSTSETPELAFAGAVAALLAISWVEQFTPGFVPSTALFHPGTEGRLLRVLLEQPLYWRAAKLDGTQSGLADGMIRRAFRFTESLEAKPKHIRSPLNELIRRCTDGGKPDNDFFDLQCGFFFAMGKADRVARALGALWGSTEKLAQNEPGASNLSAICALFETMHKRLSNGEFGARRIADAITSTKDFSREHPEAI